MNDLINKMQAKADRKWLSGWTLAAAMATSSLFYVSRASAQMVDGVLTLPSTMPVPSADVSPARVRALKLFRSITGVAVAIDDARLIQMEALINAKNERGAARIAVSDPLFYDIQLRDLAKKMSTRDETVRTQLNDFVATFIGHARDDGDARELLYGDFTYQADIAKTVTGGQQRVRIAPLDDLVRSNNHYADIENNNFSLFGVLTRVNGQLATSTNAGDAVPVPHGDAAGLITTRAFIGAHADAGTNRRLVEYSMRQFMCVTMEEWMDAGRPDDMVGRDVDRFPGGSNEKYQVTCKACHTQMDSFRQAFAYTDFVNGKIVMTPGAVVGKMNRNANEFPSGFTTVNNKWFNYALGAKNQDQFVWRTASSGTGINDFGRLLAGSKGFSRCMTKRLFTNICKRSPASNEEPIIRAIAEEFESTYRIKDLAEIVASSPACIAKD